MLKPIRWLLPSVAILFLGASVQADEAGRAVRAAKAQLGKQAKAKKQAARKAKQAAQQNQDEEKKKKAPAPDARGVVESMDTKEKTFTIRTGGKKDPNAKTITVTVNDKTKFFIRDDENLKGRPAKFDDLSARKRVAVFTEKAGDKVIAKRVVINEVKKKKQ